MKRFDLVGVDGNAYSVMGYTAHALKTAGLKDEEKVMTKEATAGDYDNLLRVCFKYVDMANKALEEQGVEFDEDDEED